VFPALFNEASKNGFVCQLDIKQGNYLGGS